MAKKRKSKNKRRGLSARIRFEVFKRDNFTCKYCGTKADKSELHIDHIIPVSMGGGDAPMNLTTSCSACNMGKGPRPLNVALVPSHDAESARIEQQAMETARLRELIEKTENQKWEQVRHIIDTVDAIWGVRLDWDEDAIRLRSSVEKFGGEKIIRVIETQLRARTRNMTHQVLIRKAIMDTLFHYLPWSVAHLEECERKPWLARLRYISAVICNRFPMERAAVESFLAHHFTAGAPVEVVEHAAKTAGTVDEFVGAVVKSYGGGK